MGWPFAGQAQNFGGCYITSHGDYICNDGTADKASERRPPTRETIPTYSGPSVVTTMGQRQESLADLVRKAAEFKENAIAAAAAAAGGACSLSGGGDFSETWDDGNGLSGWDFKDKCHPYNFNVVDGPGQPGNKAVRVENRLAGCGSAGGKSTSRNELKLKNGGTVGMQEDFWWHQRIYIPPDWPEPGEWPQKQRGGGKVGWVTVAQIIGGSHSNGLGFVPDFKLIIHNTDEWRWYGPGNAKLGKIQRGAWTDIVIHYKRSTGGDGIAQMWMNGKQVLDHKGKTTFANIPAAWKFGAYSSIGTTSRPYVLYFDDISVARGAGGVTCAGK